MGEYLPGAFAVSEGVGESREDSGGVGVCCFIRCLWELVWLVSGSETFLFSHHDRTGRLIGGCSLFNILILIATFYVGLFPVGSKPNARAFFQEYLAVPVIIV